MQSLIWIATKQFFQKKVQLKALLKRKKRISLRYMQPPPQNTRDSLNCIHFFSIILLIKNLVFINVLFSYSIYLHKQKFSSYKIFR